MASEQDEDPQKISDTVTFLNKELAVPVSIDAYNRLRGPYLSLPAFLRSVFEKNRASYPNAQGVLLMNAVTDADYPLPESERLALHEKIAQEVRAADSPAQKARVAAEKAEDLAWEEKWEKEKNWANTQKWTTSDETLLTAWPGAGDDEAEWEKRKKQDALILTKKRQQAHKHSDGILRKKIEDAFSSALTERKKNIRLVSFHYYTFNEGNFSEKWTYHWEAFRKNPSDSSLAAAFSCWQANQPMANKPDEAKEAPVAPLLRPADIKPLATWPLQKAETLVLSLEDDMDNVLKQVRIARQENSALRHIVLQVGKPEPDGKTWFYIFYNHQRNTELDLRKASTLCQKKRWELFSVTPARLPKPKLIKEAAKPKLIKEAESAEKDPTRAVLWSTERQEGITRPFKAAISFLKEKPLHKSQILVLSMEEAILSHKTTLGEYAKQARKPNTRHILIQAETSGDEKIFYLFRDHAPDAKIELRKATFSCTVKNVETFFSLIPLQPPPRVQKGWWALPEDETLVISLDEAINSPDTLTEYAKKIRNSQNPDARHLAIETVSDTGSTYFYLFHNLDWHHNISLKKASHFCKDTGEALFSRSFPYNQPLSDLQGLWELPLYRSELASINVKSAPEPAHPKKKHVTNLLQYSLKTQKKKLNSTLKRKRRCRLSSRTASAQENPVLMSHLPEWAEPSLKNMKKPAKVIQLSDMTLSSLPTIHPKKQLQYFIDAYRAECFLGQGVLYFLFGWLLPRSALGKRILGPSSDTLTMEEVEAHASACPRGLTASLLLRGNKNAFFTQKEPPPAQETHCENLLNMEITCPVL